MEWSIHLYSLSLWFHKYCINCINQHIPLIRTVSQAYECYAFKFFMLEWQILVSCFLGEILSVKIIVVTWMWRETLLLFLRTLAMTSVFGLNPAVIEGKDMNCRIYKNWTPNLWVQNDIERGKKCSKNLLYNRWISLFWSGWREGSQLKILLQIRDGVTSKLERDGFDE